MIIRIVVFLLAFTAATVKAQEPVALLGERAPEWHVSDWINSPPLKLGDLRGRVVLVRWWTAPGCRYCKASARALNEWSARHREQGLTVVGFYHHKTAGPLRVAEVEAQTANLGLTFPVAVDRDWRTLKEWWLDRDRDGRWTSVSFLLDRTGRVRFVHPGGEYLKGDAAYSELDAKLTELLAER